MQLKIVFFKQYSSEVQGPKCTRKARLKKRTHACSFLKRAQKKLIRVYAVVFCFTLYKLLRSMSVDLKFSTLKLKVIAWNLKINQFFSSLFLILIQLNPLSLNTFFCVNGVLIYPK